MLDRMKSDFGNEEAIDENPMETAPEEISAPVYTDSLRVLLDRKGRKGKDATIVEGSPSPIPRWRRLPRASSSVWAVGALPVAEKFLFRATSVRLWPQFCLPWDLNVRF